MVDDLKLCRKWPWVQSGYFTLRCLVLIMKMHSYMAVNGYLQSVDDRARKTETLLREKANELGGWDQAVSDARSRREDLDQLDSTPSETPLLMGDSRSSLNGGPAATALRNRLNAISKAPSMQRSNMMISSQTDSPPLTRKTTTPTPHVLVDHPDKELSGIAVELSEMEAELTSDGKEQVRWPANLTWRNYIDYQFLPTLVYELEYPRTDRLVHLL